MSDWVPSPLHLETFTHVLSASISLDSDNRLRALEQLDIAKASIADCNNYLAYIFLQGGDSATIIRSAAGLLLKNNVKLEYSNIPSSSLSYIKEASFHGLRDQEMQIRSIAGNIITSIIYRGGIMAWPEALPRLMQYLDDSNERLNEGAFSALSKICEDSAKELDREYEGTRPLDFMIPKFLSYADHPKAKLRSEALFCLNQFILLKSNSLFCFIDEFLTRLFSLATDPDPTVRKHVCQALVMLLDVRPDKIAPHLKPIVEYMMHSTQDADDDVALEACEFWLAIAEQPDLQSSLEPYLHKIVPMLLKGMVYTEMDLLALNADDDDAHLADKVEDIRPQHAKAKIHMMNESAQDSNGSKPAGLKFHEAALEDEEEDDDYDDDDDELYTEWNLRKCSAAALDVLSTVYEARLLEQCLPHLKSTLASTDWKEQEAGVLALGAIAEGCMTGMIPILPEIFPHLLAMLRDKQPLVRQITCWTLGRYGRWAAHLPEVEKQKYFLPLMEGLLSTMLDNNKRVQEAGCSAFANLEDQAGIVLVPYLLPILQHFVAAFQKYQQKNLLLLYDAVQTLADAVGPALNKPEFIEMIMQPLIQRWQATDDDDRDLFPLLECLSSVTIALGAGFAQFAPPVFSRSIHILHRNLAQIEAYTNGSVAELPEKDFLITALDLLSGLVQGLGPDVSTLIAQNQPSLMQLLLMCFVDPVTEVRQSAYALLGDLVINCFADVKPYLSQVMQELITQIDPKTDSVSVTNNATWSAGEICLQAGQDLAPWVDPLMQKLVAIMQAPKTGITVLENASITLGRLGSNAPEKIAPHMTLFVGRFCHSLQNSLDNDEKDSAFKGLCQMIAVHPTSLGSFFPDFVNAVGRFGDPSPELRDMFSKILLGFQPMYPDWDRLMQQLDPKVKQAINMRSNQCSVSEYWTTRWFGTVQYRVMLRPLDMATTVLHRLALKGANSLRSQILKLYSPIERDWQFWSTSLQNYELDYGLIASLIAVVVLAGFHLSWPRIQQYCSKSNEGIGTKTIVTDMPTIDTFDGSLVQPQIRRRFVKDVSDISQWLSSSIKTSANSGAEVLENPNEMLPAGVNAQNDRISQREYRVTGSDVSTVDPSAVAYIRQQIIDRVMLTEVGDENLDDGEDALLKLEMINSIVSLSDADILEWFAINKDTLNQR